MGLPSSSNMPFTTSCTVPSPPTATTNRPPASRVSEANRVASPGPSVLSNWYGNPRERRVRSSSGTSSPTRRRPARGFTITVSSPEGLGIGRILLRGRPRAVGDLRSDPRVRHDPAVDRRAGVADDVRDPLRGHDLDLTEQVEHLLAGAHEVARRHVRFAQDVLERLPLGPPMDRSGEPVLELPAKLDLVPVLRFAHPTPDPLEPPVAFHRGGRGHLAGPRVPLT